jgi:hypothetical protein
MWKNGARQGATGKISGYEKHHGQVTFGGPAAESIPLAGAGRSFVGQFFSPPKGSPER